MSSGLITLLITAASVGIIHTILGPDHYVPFIALAKACKWSKIKTTTITLLCGVGHVLSSVVIGMIGLTLGLAITSTKNIESIRGEIASWLLISFGLIYFVWGIKKVYKNKPHTHSHMHINGTTHEHAHIHKNNHEHVHEEINTVNVTPWILFIIFVFGPCEALIPIFMYTAATENLMNVILVTFAFGIATILTMLTVILFSLSGLQRIKLGKYEKYSYASAGFIILLCGVVIKVFGL